MGLADVLFAPACETWYEPLYFEQPLDLGGDPASHLL
jgi:hypothetical protein